MRGLILAAAMIALTLASTAAAQNNAQPRDTSGVRQLTALLDYQHRERGYSTDAALEDWTQTLQRQNGQNVGEHRVQLLEGVTYRVVGVCDVNCRNVDMEAFDSTDVSVAIDNQGNDSPVLDITPLHTDTFLIRITLRQCNARACDVAGRVLRRDPGGSGPVPGMASGSATGFLVTSTGLIVTNNHVVAGARNISVEFNGANVPATVVARDPANDVAVIRAAVTGTPLVLSPAGATMRGQDVMTLGYPLPDIQGQEQKASFGHVNALSGLQDDVRYLQIDVPIQPGNSGGPLLNDHGQVIGVVSATVDQSAVVHAAGTIAQNVNYAVKADYVLPLIPDAERAPAGVARTAHSFADVATSSQGSVFRITVSQ